MKYGIVENHKFILIDEDRQRLENTLPFMPQYSVEQIGTYDEDQIEQGHDGAWYEKGHAPQRPLEEARTEKLAELEAAFDTASREGLSTRHPIKRIVPHRSGSRSMPTKSPTATSKDWCSSCSRKRPPCSGPMTTPSTKSHGSNSKPCARKSSSTANTCIRPSGRWKPESGRQKQPKR